MMPISLSRSRPASSAILPKSNLSQIPVCVIVISPSYPII